MSFGAHLVVMGRVQGVGFRAFTCRRASHYGLTGWVKNTVDGRVESEAEGSQTAVDEFLRDLKQGPPWSSVEEVEVNWIESRNNETAFEVVY